MNKDIDPEKVALKAIQLYVETHPRPPHVTRKQAAEMLRVSESTIHRLINAGKMRLNGCGLVPIGEIDRVLEPH